MSGKIALVTGGSTGIGLATAQAFAHEGATVIIASRNEKREAGSNNALGRWPWKMDAVRCDGRSRCR
ncbi:SDR family NAD(P)-dependent oxidoreductase [Mesorhizobium sp. B2-9-1]|nr:SDR family NAD(P)-dependent oxidoreductase [Mesorhizobium sp. B2-9-1]TPJ28996.1 SDR family NAD(P)-dependent oxidoreductase [Mesorhizobium sp. B2-7-2]